METTIKDDFSLNRIAQSGQCFRVPEFPDGTYRFVTGSHILYIKEIDLSVIDHHDDIALFTELKSI